MFKTLTVVVVDHLSAESRVSAQAVVKISMTEGITVPQEMQFAIDATAKDISVPGATLRQWPTLRLSLISHLWTQLFWELLTKATSSAPGQFHYLFKNEPFPLSWTPERR